jgi:hypothetical protein
MARPNIQIDDLVREMTDEEYAALIESGWTESEPGEQPAPTVEEVEAPAYAPDTRTFGDANPDVNPDGL